MSVLPEEFMLLAFNRYASSSEAGVAFLKMLQEVGAGVWESDRLKEPERRRVYIALRDIEPAYRAFVDFIELLPLSEEDKERAHFRLVKLMDDLAVVGGQSVLTPDGRRFARGLQGPDANKKKVEKAHEKNDAMWEHIMAEAVEQKRDLVDSLECGLQLAPGVRMRMGVERNARGFSAATIRKQIRSILKERNRS